MSDKESSPFPDLLKAAMAAMYDYASSRTLPMDDVETTAEALIQYVYELEQRLGIVE